MMATRNAPAHGLKGTARRFLRAKIGPFPAPLVAGAAIVGVWYLHRRSQGSSAGTSSGGTTGMMAPGETPTPSDSTGGEGSGGGGYFGGGGGPTYLGPPGSAAAPITKLVRNRVRKIVVQGNVRGGIGRGARGGVTRRGGTSRVVRRKPVVVRTPTRKLPATMGRRRRV